MTTEEITYRSDIVVEPIDRMGGDQAVLRAMLVASNQDDASEWADPGSPKNAGRINSLMRDRHGTPFEHACMTFYVEAPIFVFREWHRHRIGISINEMSGRYSELPPQFYVPPLNRPLVKVEGSKQMQYLTEMGTLKQRDIVEVSMHDAYSNAYDCYQVMLAAGILKEVARMVLPVGIYSKMYWTCNPRSLMSFLQLRVRRTISTFTAQDDGTFIRADEGSGHAMFPSNPQWEIDIAAQICEQTLAEHWPVTYRAFQRNGRVAP